jgi:hypothetical protein
MSTIKIEIDNEEIQGIDAEGINQRINRRRNEGRDICVRVSIKADEIDMILSTPNCSSGGRRRLPRLRESKVLDLWKRRGLNDSNFNGGDLIAFLRQLEQLV